jgi:NADPH-dependent curcumin reductase CurA
MTVRNQRIELAAVPVGMPREEDFRITEVPVPECPANGLLVRTTWISVDPYLRGRIGGVRTYVDPIPVGAAMESGAVGEVVASQHPEFQRGDIVSGFWSWQNYVAVDGARVLRVDPREAPVSAALGILGVTGITAYFGLLEICAGSAAKVEHLHSLGFDGALNYKTDLPYAKTLARLCPAGIDCYFDNVGGDFTDAVFRAMNVRGRVAVCGQISQYNDFSKDVGPRPFAPMIARQLRVEGFLVTRWWSRFPEARTRLAEWLKEGRLRHEETVYEGLENAPRAFIGLFHGENTGKAVVKIAGDSAAPV